MSEREAGNDLLFFRIKSLARHSAIYGLFEFLGKAGSFLLVPLYANLLPTSDYGLLELLAVTGSVLVILNVLGFNSALTRYYVTATSDMERISFFRSAFWTVTLAGGAVTFVLFQESPVLSNLVFGTADHGLFLRVLVLTAYIDSLSTIFLALFRAQSRPLLYSSVSLAKLGITLAANIYLVAILGLGIPGVLAGNLIGSCAGFLFGIALALREQGGSLSRTAVSQLARFGLPLVVSGLGLFLMNSSDRYFLRAYATFSDLGVYAVGYKVGMVMALFVNAFTVAWPPLMFTISADQNAKQTFSRILTYYLLVTVGLFLSITFFRREIVALISMPDYAAASEVVPFVVLSYLLQGAYYILSSGVAVTDKTRFVPLVVGGGTLVNLTANMILIPSFGIMGAAVATLVSYAVLPAGMLVASQRYYRISFEHDRILKLCILAGFVLLIDLFLLPSEGPVGWTLKALLLTLFPVMLHGWKFFSKEELFKMKSWIRKLFQTEPASP